MRLLAVFTIMACSGQAAPTVAVPPTPPPRREIVLPVREPVPVVIGVACDDANPCGKGLQCERSTGGYCTRACGDGCGDAVCVENPTARQCRAECKTNDDCRDGYACDLAWRACIVPNSAAIAVKDCGAPKPDVRDPAFAPSTVVSTGDEPREPSLVIADDGTLVIAYAGTNGIGVSRIDARGELIRDRPLAIGTQHASLARDGARIYAVALGHGDKRVGFATSTDRGATWKIGEPVDDPRECASGPCATRPLVVIGPKDVFVTYAAGNGLRVRASRDGGATFGPPRTALTGAYGSLDVAADGTVYAIGVSGRSALYGSGDNRIEFAYSIDAGRSFYRPVQMNITGERIPFYFANPSVAYDDARRWLYLAYARGGRDGKWDIALLATNDQGKTWRRTRIGDDPPCAIHMVPNLALDPKTGQLHVAWYDSRGGRFAHAACTYGLGLCRQLGRINDQPFAALSTMRTGELAVGDYQALVVDNTRRILHAVWTQPVLDGGKPVARIFHAKAKLPLF